MAAGHTTTTLDFILKDMYPDGNLPASLVTKNSALLNLLPKEKNPKKTGGRKIPVPVKYAPNAGGSYTDTTALTANGYVRGEVFELTHVSYYNRATISGLALECAIGDRTSFVDGLEASIEGCNEDASNALIRGIVKGRGSIGRIKAGTSTASTTIYLSDPNDAVNFEVGMEICASSADGTGSLRAATSCGITGVDRSNGTLTTDIAIASDISGCVAGDYLFRLGNHGTGLYGLDSWIPTSAPSSAAFNGVDRSVDPDRLAGVRIAANGSNLKDVVIDGLSKVSRIGGGTPTVVALNDSLFADLAKDLNNQIVLSDSKSGNIGFQHLNVAFNGGMAKVVAERFIPADRIYLLEPESWKLFSIGETPRIFGYDSKVDRVSGEDSYEVRIGWRAQLGCFAPGHNGVITGI